MDYVEAFGKLKANEKYGRKTPHKAILLLTIMEMYESNMISSNEIRCDQLLEDAFLKVWNRTLPNDVTSYPSVLLPFWTMQNEEFWHLVPKRGKEEVLSFLKENQMKLSENKIKDCVDYAELDEDLYFQMSLPSGRSLLKRVLLEKYSHLSNESIDCLSESQDNQEDKSIVAMDEYKQILSSVSRNETPTGFAEEVGNDEIRKNFYRLDEDVQIQLNIEYYTYLKEHKAEREIFKEICPTVYELYNKVTRHPVRAVEIAPSFKFIYENFLMDLKINLLGVDGAFDVVEGIDHAIALLKEDAMAVSVTAEERTDVVEQNNSSASADEASDLKPRRMDLPWTENEEELLVLCFDKGKSVENMASLLGRSQREILLRLANLGKIEYKPEYSANLQDAKGVDQASSLDYYVENMEKQCFILNRNGERVYTTDGKFKIFHGKLYRFNYKNGICFTVKDMVRTDGVWDKGSKQIVAYIQTDLFSLLDRNHYIEQIEDLHEGASMKLNKIRVDGKWYNFDGDLIGEATEPLLNGMNANMRSHNQENSFAPVGNLDKIAQSLTDFYDYLWLMAIVDIMGDESHSLQVSFDELACMMIAEGWSLMESNPSLRASYETMTECIEYLIEESEANMGQVLSWKTPCDAVFAAIKDYPMSGVFEDFVDELVQTTPMNVLHIWLEDKDLQDLVLHSANFVNQCLYSLHLNKFDSYIEVNPAWKNYLLNEHDNLLDYIADKCLLAVKS